jgi:hypothetical protein
MKRRVVTVDRVWLFFVKFIRMMSHAFAFSFQCFKNKNAFQRTFRVGTHS